MANDPNQNCHKEMPREIYPLTSDRLQDKGKGWISLFRPPNLFTIPGDPLVGALLAAMALNRTLAWNPVYVVIGAALAFYASGLLANDFFDRSVDARERPSRPIPSGAASPAAVRLVAIGLTAIGLILTLPAGRTALTAGILLALAVWFYNAAGKRIAWLSPFAMGICRGLSLLLGASVMGLQGIMAPSVLVAALFLTLFIALITLIARHEANPDDSRIPNWSRWGIPVILTVWLTVTLAPRWTHLTPLTIILTAMSLLWAIVWTAQLNPNAKPRVIQASVAGLIRGLLFTQAAICASCGGTGEGAALLLVFFFPVSGWLGKWFYGS
ncbi:MAG: UbiA family prenyltransferase [bacterium]